MGDAAGVCQAVPREITTVMDDSNSSSLWVVDHNIAKTIAGISHLVARNVTCNGPFEATLAHTEVTGNNIVAGSAGLSRRHTEG